LLFVFWNMTDIAARITELIAPSLEGLGYDLVRVQVEGRRTARVEIMAERRDGRPTSVEDCAQISRTASALLDVNDPIAGSYRLEVTSPGIDRPLLRPLDYQRFVGQAARIELKTPIQGRRRFSGTILDADEATVRIDLGEGVSAALPLAEIARAKLILTDRLIAATRPHTSTVDEESPPA
jgi:ribosome maturation factor RimP